MQIEARNSQSRRRVPLASDSSSGNDHDPACVGHPFLWVRCQRLRLSQMHNLMPLRVQVTHPNRPWPASMRQQAEVATADLSVLPTRVRFSTSGSIADPVIPQAIKILNAEIVAVVRFPQGGGRVP